MEDRITEKEMLAEDVLSDQNLRPKSLKDYIGQKDVIDNLEVFIKAAKKRSESLDHVLFFGSAGLGKTTLSCIIANELSADIKITSGPTIEKAGDLAAILTNLTENDVLFIDEIHRLNRTVEEVLYSAMEDYAIDIIIGKGPSARSIRLDIPKFTLVGATTRAGNLTAPLRDRFGIVSKFNLYSNDELKQIVNRSAGILGIKINDKAASEIAKRSRGTPRIANRILKRVRDFSEVSGKDEVDINDATKALDALGIDSEGLEDTDRRILSFIIDRFTGGPVGIDTIAASIGEERITIEDVYEPYLLQEGFIHRTPKGRVASEKAYEHLGINIFN